MGTNISNSWLENTCARAFYIKGIDIERAYNESTCISSPGAVKYLEMHLQSFWILEVEDIRLKIQVGIG